MDLEGGEKEVDDAYNGGEGWITVEEGRRVTDLLYLGFLIMVCLNMKIVVHNLIRCILGCFA